MWAIRRSSAVDPSVARLEDRCPVIVVAGQELLPEVAHDPSGAGC
jgi:hypothetical protein